MQEISFQYWNALAEQTIFISSLLGGFSIAVIANFLTSDHSEKIHKAIMVAATLAASFFLISVFAMTTVLLKTTPGYPSAVDQNSIVMPRLVGGSTVYLGIVALMTFIAMSGWTKSKKLGIFTTIVGLLTLVITILMTAG